MSIRSCYWLVFLMIAQGPAYSGPSIGFDYDVSIKYDDDGLSKTSTFNPPSTTTVSQTGYLSVVGSSEDDVSYEIYFSLTSGIVNDAVEVALAKKALTDDVTLAVGKTYLNKGGWDEKNINYATIAVSSYVANINPLKSSDTVAQVDTNLGDLGALTIQITNDVLNNGTNGYHNQDQRQPAGLIQWIKDYDSFTPLVQFIPYDSGHSTQMVLGLKVHTGKLTAYFDLVNDKRSNTNKETTTYNSIVADVTYEAGSLTPFFKFSTFDAKQETDQKGNATANVLDDNATTLMVGATIHGISENFAPYFAFVNRSAKFITNGITNETQSRNGNQIIAGIGGSIR